MLNDFGSFRSGTGTKEWSEHSFNIQIGCSNNCMYCFAAHNAARFKTRIRSEWYREELTSKANIPRYPKRSGVVMAPTAHDISPYNVDAFVRVARLILHAGNRLLIVSKPRIDCIREVCAGLNDFSRDLVLFRFSIGSMFNRDVAFWEPGASWPDERIACLEYAKSCGYHTSVSIEPFLGGIRTAMKVVEAVRPHVTDDIWIGKMNRVQQRVDMSDPTVAEAVRYIQVVQRDDEIMELYRKYADDPVIRWKDSIKEVVARHAC